jgi:hypothetical protein
MLHEPARVVPSTKDVCDTCDSAHEVPQSASLEIQKGHNRSYGCLGRQPGARNSVRTHC